MSTANARKGYELHRAVVQSADPITGITQVKIPDLLGSHVVDVHWAGLENTGGTYQTPVPGDMSLVAVSNDGTQIMWVLSADHTPLWDGIQQADAAIADLTADIADLTADLAVVAAGVVTNTADIAALEAAVGVLEFDVDTLSASATTLAASVSTLNSTVVKTVAGTANQVLVNGGTAAATGNPVLSLPQSIGTTSNPTFSSVQLSDAAGTFRQVSFRTAGILRWNLYTSSAAESGANAGSNLLIVRHDDAGTSLGTAVSISRANSAVTLGGSISTPSQLISTVATGTAPLAVTSTTNVANLNADQLDGCHIITSTTAPTISTNPGLGTGSTHTANWMYIGPTTTGAVGLLSLHGVITLGTSPTMGDVRITLPGSYTVPNAVAGLTRAGTAGYKLAGVTYNGIMRTETSSVMRFIVSNASGTYLTDTALAGGGTPAPAAWAAGDTIAYNIHCQVVYP